MCIVLKQIFINFARIISFIFVATNLDLPNWCYKNDLHLPKCGLDYKNLYVFRFFFWEVLYLLKLLERMILLSSFHRSSSKFAVPVQVQLCLLYMYICNLFFNECLLYHLLKIFRIVFQMLLSIFIHFWMWNVGCTSTCIDRSENRFVGSAITAVSPS